MIKIDLKYAATLALALVLPPFPASAVEDFGDAPDTFQTTLSVNGARHTVDFFTYMGNSVDGEADGFPTPGADGDDLDTSDDEDGVSIDSPLISNCRAYVTVRTSVPYGRISAWMDLNNDGDFSSDPISHKVLLNKPISAYVNYFTILIPPGSAQTNIIARFRFTGYDPSLPGNCPAGNCGGGGIRSGGPALDGEVEDYLVTVVPRSSVEIDYGDLTPAVSFNTTRPNYAAGHIIKPGVHLGATVDAESNGFPSVFFDGDDLDGVDDEDGVTFLTPVVPGTEAYVQVVASTSGYLNAWIDFDDNKWFIATNLPVNKVFQSQYLVQGTNVLKFDVASIVNPDNPIASRWRFTSRQIGELSGLDSDGVAPDGEVEDHLVDIISPTFYDWGDAPENNFHSLDLAPAHRVVPGVYLGATVDGDPGGQPGPMALGDDALGDDDEDGVIFPLPLQLLSPAEVHVTASTSGYLSAWVDYNGDQDWVGDPNENIFSGEPLTQGVNVLSFQLPRGVVAQPTAMTRFRFTTNNVALPPSSIEDNGEVEDHAVNIRLPIDTDGDGMPDWWEQEHFGNPTNALPWDDEDGDVVLNFDEFIAFTDPMNSNSYLFIHQTWSTNFGDYVAFTSSVYRDYYVLFATNIVDKQWTTFPIPETGTGGEIIMSFTNSARARVLRVDVKIPY